MEDIKIVYERIFKNKKLKILSFFIFLKLFQKYDIIKSIKGDKKGVFLE